MLAKAVLVARTGEGDYSGLWGLASILLAGALLWCEVRRSRELARGGRPPATATVISALLVAALFVGWIVVWGIAPIALVLAFAAGFVRARDSTRRS